MKWAPPVRVKQVQSYNIPRGKPFFNPDRKEKMMKWKEKAGMTLDFSLYQRYLIKTSKNVSRLLFVPKESPTGKIAF
jgi:hypothetical protein